MIGAQVDALVMWTYVRISYENWKKKESYLLKWIPTNPTNDTDLHTKNLAGTDFEKHVEVYIGKEECLSMS